MLTGFGLSNQEVPKCLSVPSGPTPGPTDHLRARLQISRTYLAPEQSHFPPDCSLAEVLAGIPQNPVRPRLSV